MPKVSEAHLEARRRQIVEAAQRCFARRGFHAATMQQICAEAELSPGAIYRYFKGKQEILEAVFDVSLADNRGLSALADAHDDPRAGLDALLATIFGMLEDPSLRDDMRFGLMVHGEAMRDPRIAARYAGVLRTMVGSMRGLMERLQAAGAVDPALPPDDAVRVLAALWEGYRVLRLVDPDVSTERFVAAARSMLLDGARDAGAG